MAGSKEESSTLQRQVFVVHEPFRVGRIGWYGEIETTIRKRWYTGTKYLFRLIANKRQDVHLKSTLVQDHHRQGFALAY